MMMRSSWNTTLLQLQRLQISLQQHQLSISHQSTRCFSSLPRPKKISKKGTESNEAESTDSRPKQPFTNFKLEPGEWDMSRKDPYYRPKPPPRSRLISAEDFANRPPVGFENEFSSLDDSMIALSWMDDKTCQQIYKSYIDIMVQAEQDHPGRTSHEYACRVLAQRYQITPWRAAGVIQLQHNEEQMRRNNPELLCEEQAKYAEEMILQNIRDAYRSDRSENPNQYQPFVEDPVGIHGRGPPDEISTSFVSADDIYDMEAKLKEANERDDKLAQILIDDYVYTEDVDESTLQVKTDGAAKRLIKAQQEQRKQEQNKKTSEREIPYPETNAQGEKRPRWKYVAKVVNTRAMKKKGRRLTSYTNNNMTNTLVEEDGNLRVATVEEAKQVAWKPSRMKGTEYIYENVQKAWLERTLKKKTDAWGRVPRQSAAAAVIGDETDGATKKTNSKASSEEETVNVAAAATAVRVGASDDVVGPAEKLSTAAVEDSTDVHVSPEDAAGQDSQDQLTTEETAANDGVANDSEKVSKETTTESNEKE
ncbi:hypothetical protein IV203_012232 [Nitzschia inconspicua]|uniref:Uncharacterized protein n=1 Tax=Nitzschia inconspicua TaxID=303405 RepID=A0A9K3KUU6_9STRA|nr:hypothetical protein IV203_012232 [Nitzschia inconspicua]